MRRRVVEELGGVNEDLHYVMDREMWLRAGTHYKTHYLEGEILANFRYCPGTKSYEKAALFHAEWRQVIERTFQQSEFNNLSNAIKKHALRQVKSKFHLACMVQAAKKRRLGSMFQQLYLAVMYDWKLFFNRGIWAFVFEGVSGFKLVGR